MADTALNRYIMEGTAAQRATYVPQPATVAAGQPLGVFWFETDTAKLFCWNSTTNAWVQVSGSGGGGGTAVTLRGTSQAVGVGASTVINLPVGCVKGDLAIIMAGCGNSGSATPPTGWLILDRQTAGFCEEVAYFRVLSQSDITAGNVTVSFTGAFDNVVCMAVVQGNALIRPMNQGSVASNPGTNGTSASASTDGSPGATDLVLMFAAGRQAAGGTLTNTTSFSTGTKQQQMVSQATAPQVAGCLYTLTPSGAGDITGTATWSVLVATNIYLISLHPGGTA